MMPECASCGAPIHEGRFAPVFSRRALIEERDRAVRELEAAGPHVESLCRQREALRATNTRRLEKIRRLNVEIEAHELAREETAEALAKLSAGFDQALRAVNALAGLEELFRRPGEDATASFERVAEAFHRETGVLRPGKSYPAADPGPPDEERTAKYEAWVGDRLARARAVLAREASR